jgi:hypothetical protein
VDQKARAFPSCLEQVEFPYAELHSVEPVVPTGSSLRRIQSENNAFSRRNFISRVYVQGCGAVRRSLHLAEFDLPLSPMVTQTRQGRSGNRIRESQEALVLLCGWARWRGERGVAANSRQKRTQAVPGRNALTQCAATVSGMPVFIVGFGEPPRT